MLSHASTVGIEQRSLLKTSTSKRLARQESIGTKNKSLLVPLLISGHADVLIKLQACEREKHLALEAVEKSELKRTTLQEELEATVATQVHRIGEIV